jgi:hypothetical protein
LALAALLLVEALICSLLMIPIQNRKLSKVEQMCLNLRGSGSSQALFSD